MSFFEPLWDKYFELQPPLILNKSDMNNNNVVKIM